MLNESDRPTVSFMYQHNNANLKDRINTLSVHIDPLIAGNLHDENPVIEEFNSENFQLTKDLEAASNLVALLFCAVVLFIFVFRFAKRFLLQFCRLFTPPKVYSSTKLENLIANPRNSPTLFSLYSE
ncbi:hypothetical protein KUH03_38600 [Sphingobacterium sp. E70]|uniref:hypothetical protein n=1 Tax=Sphingobacterium sp. E70 TaxID=2853439 RepID=UPI00211C1CFF|nr:hypothetical protein [Sphingobacterium sp. E70]ULT24755.1 hypothetical protein KUH03_38600 [Sphingobacterium sp. E70]